MPQEVQTSQFLRVDGERNSDLNEPLEIRSREHAALEAARDDVRLFAIFLDDYHIDKRPDITLPLRDALTKFVIQFDPNDLMVLMDPLTTLYDLKYTRSKADVVSRIRAFEGRRGEVFPVKSVIEEAQMSQRNWQELRAGVTLRRSPRSPRSSAACARAASRSCSSARARPFAPAAPTTSG